MTTTCKNLFILLFLKGEKAENTSRFLKMRKFVLFFFQKRNIMWLTRQKIENKGEPEMLVKYSEQSLTRSSKQGTYPSNPADFPWPS